MMIPIDEIRVGKRIRPLREDVVGSLMESIRTIGLQGPISVAPVEKREAGANGASFELIVGNHRLEACKRLGWSEIECNIVQIDDAERELWEIDENLCRAELTELERGEHLARRKEVYEVLHPGSRRGGDRRSEEFQTENSSVRSFAKDIAEKVGVTDRAIRQSIRRVSEIDEKVRDRIRKNLQIADSGVELDALAQLAPENQRKAVDLVERGEASSIRDARQRLGVARTPSTGAVVPQTEMPPRELEAATQAPPAIKPEERPSPAPTLFTTEQEIVPRVPEQSVSTPSTHDHAANPASAIQKMAVAKAVRRFARAVGKRLETVGADGEWYEAAAAAFVKGEELPARPPSREEIEAARQEELRRMLD